MNEQVWWYLARAAGVVTLVLLVAGLVLGVLLSTRAMKPHDRPAWLLAMHRWMSSLVLAGTAVHVLALVADSYITMGLREVLVPMTSSWRPVAVTVGVVTLYLLLVVHLSSVLMRKLPKRLWRGIHSLSALLVWTAVVHGALAGADAASPAYQVVAWVLIALSVSAGVVGVLLGRGGQRAAAGRAGGRAGGRSARGDASPVGLER